MQLKETISKKLFRKNLLSYWGVVIFLLLTMMFIYISEKAPFRLESFISLILLVVLSFIGAIIINIIEDDLKGEKIELKTDGEPTYISGGFNDLFYMSYIDDTENVFK